MLKTTVDLAFERYALQRKLHPRRSRARRPRTAAQASEEGLRNSLELLRSYPHFLDLDLGFDRQSKQFYAGCETAANLRELIGTILLQKAPPCSSTPN